MATITRGGTFNNDVPYDINKRNRESILSLLEFHENDPDSKQEEEEQGSSKFIKEADYFNEGLINKSELEPSNDAYIAKYAPIDGQMFKMGVRNAPLAVSDVSDNSLLVDGL